MKLKQWNRYKEEYSKVHDAAVVALRKLKAAEIHLERAEKMLEEKEITNRMQCEEISRLKELNSNLWVAVSVLGVAVIALVLYGI